MLLDSLGSLFPIQPRFLFEGLCETLESAVRPALRGAVIVATRNLTAADRFRTVSSLRLPLTISSVAFYPNSLALRQRVFVVHATPVATSFAG